MNRNLRPRFWLEAALAGTTGLLFIMTAVYPEWVEALFQVEPDAGSGSLEWLVVGVLLAVTMVTGLLARGEWVRGRLSTPN